MTILKHELKQNAKSLIIWTFCIVFICFGCLLLYSSLEGSLDEMNDMYANLGPMATAVGLDKMGINTVKGYYATEISIMFAIGSGMFAALVGISMLSKEEEGHTAEFLHTFPVSRKEIVVNKYIAMVLLLLIFNVICIAFDVLGFVILDATIGVKSFTLYHALQYLMQLEIATVCFLVSSMNKKKMIGLGLGVTILFYAADLMCRIIPSIKNLKYITPFYYSNAADIFSNGRAEMVPVVIGSGILIVALIGSFFVYERRDIQ